MSTYKERLSKAIEEVGDKLSNMSQEEFKKELDKYKDSDRAKAIYYAWNPDWDGERIVY